MFQLLKSEWAQNHASNKMSGLSLDLIINRCVLGLYYGFSYHQLWKEGSGIQF